MKYNLTEEDLFLFILYPSGVLTFDKNKTLKIVDRGGTRLELYSASIETANTNTSTVVATLLDSGNFVVQEVNSIHGSKNRVLWQSFDHPIDTLYPGMKLGVNHRNGHILSLTKSSSQSNPEPGPFTLEWDYKTQELQIKRRGVVYWTSGASTSKRFKQLMSRYNISIVSNETEASFTYHPLNQTSTEWVLSLAGQLDNGGEFVIARTENCYGYNTDGGCQRWAEKPTCRHVGDIFELKRGYFKPTISNKTYPIDPNTSLNIKTRIFIGTSITAATLPLMVPCIACYVLRRRKFALSGTQCKKETKIIEDELLDLMKSDRPTDANAHQNHGYMRPDLSVFSYASVMAATCNFSPENKLGQGGFGPVYKGKLVKGQEVAVKRLSKCSGQGTLEFKNELVLIYELQHKNLVKLFGFCIHGEETMLIYECQTKVWTTFYSVDSTRITPLDWKKRFIIIEGIAQGLLYLHKYSRVTVIHRDLKASNILLDENMNPKISDFGMARIFKHNELEANTNRVVGTYGYMPPEYTMQGIFSIKSDVYSFGVLMLEVVSGRRNNSFYNADCVLNIVGYAWELWKEATVLELMDPTLGDSCIKDQLLRCVHVGLLCAEENAANRPTMSDVLSMLTNQSTPLPLPEKPAFFTGRNVVEAGLSGKEPEIFSTDEISNSTDISCPHHSNQLIRQAQLNLSGKSKLCHKILLVDPSDLISCTVKFTESKRVAAILTMLESEAEYSTSGSPSLCVQMIFYTNNLY
ncbi:unnamed protein product [Malus baccata var. baccata]